MENKNSTRLTPSAGRRFAFTVGGAFLVLATFFWWREHSILMWITGSLGGALTVAGIILPGHLDPVWRAWMAFARVISHVTNPLVLGLIYYLVITPTALLRRLIGGNPLKRTPQESSFWVSRDDEGTTSDLSRQF